MKAKRLLGPMVSACSLGLSVLLAEIFLKAFAPVPDPYVTYKQKLRQSTNPYIASSLPPKYSVKTEIEQGLPGMQGVHSFSTNNKGFRGDDLVSPKPAGEFRIFIVGGSTTECLYLDDSESLERVAQDELNRDTASGTVVKVYNAGKSGDASDDHISMIVHRIVHLSPDLIVVFCGINDLCRSIAGYDYLHYRRTDESDVSSNAVVLAKFLATEFQIPRRVYYLARGMSYQSERDILEIITLTTNYKAKVELRKSHPPSDRPPNTDVDSYRRNMETIAGVAQAHGIRLVLMTQQTTWNSAVDSKASDWHWILYRGGVTYREDLMDRAMESLNAAVRGVAERHTIPVYDVAREIPKSLEFFYDDVHFNVKGAHAAGVGLAALIMERNLLRR